MAIVLEYAEAGELFEFVAQERFSEEEARYNSFIISLEPISLKC